MAGITKDVNFTFLWLLLLLLTAMAGMSLYYQSTYGDISQRYEKARAELDTAMIDLQTRERALNEGLAELNIAKEREQALGGRYTELKGEKESTEAALSRTQKELADQKVENIRLNKELSYTQQSLTAAQKAIEQFSAENANLRATVFAMQSTIQSLYAQIASLEAQIRALQQPR